MVVLKTILKLHYPGPSTLNEFRTLNQLLNREHQPTAFCAWSQTKACSHRQGVPESPDANTIQCTTPRLLSCLPFCCRQTHVVVNEVQPTARAVTLALSEYGIHDLIT
jgi:hypothetical protein